MALAACDVHRPAAVDQLSRWAGRPARTSTSRAPDATRSTSPSGRSARPRQDGRDVLIVDTAGRLHVDEELMEELAQVKKRTKPHNVLLVVDAMTGQDAVNVAEALRRGRGLRRRGADQARRRRPRRRRAVGQGRHRQADPLRLDRREARRLRALPPRPDGPADPRHGRRHDADREGRAARSTSARRRSSSARSARSSSRSTTSSTRCSRCATWGRSATC